MNRISQTNSAALKFPGYLSVIYLAFTLIVYVLCPYDWPTQNPILFYGLNLAYILMFFVGYQLGEKFTFRFKLIEWTDDKTEKLLRVVSYLTIANFCFLLIHVFRDYGYRTFNFAGLFRDMLVGIKNPGIGYLLHVERQAVLNGSDVMGGYVYTLFSMIWSFVKLPIAILSLLYFKKLRPLAKLFAILYPVLIVMFYLSIGTNIQVFHVFLLLELPIIMETFEWWYHKKLNAKRIIKLIAFILLGCVLLGGYFGWMMESRSNASGYEIGDYEIGGIAPQKPTQEHTQASTQESTQEPTQAPTQEPTQEPTQAPTQENDGATEDNSSINQKLYNLWLSFSSYLTQGYYGMSQALSVNWTPMFGFGNSMFVVDMVSNYVYDIDQFTYQVKLEEFGWDSNVRWHTMYTWLANDVSFYGVVIVMLLIGMLLAMMFKDAVVTKNPFARASIFFYILMLIFIPCNNQIAQSNETLFAFLLLIGLWLICGRNPQQSSDSKKE